MKSIKLLGAALAAFITLGSASHAAIVVYYDRTAWETALGTAPTTMETFDTMSPGTYSAPATFPSGISTTTGVGTVSSLAWSSVSQGQGFELTSSSMTFSPNTTGVYAIGFDYADNDFPPPTSGGPNGGGPSAGFNISLNGVSYMLPRTGSINDGVSLEDFGFFGIIATTSEEIAGGVFELYQEMGTNPPRITIDNLTIAVPEPSTGYLPLMALGLLAGVRRRKRN